MATDYFGSLINVLRIYKILGPGCRIDDEIFKENPSEHLPLQNRPIFSWSVCFKHDGKEFRSTGEGDTKKGAKKVAAKIVLIQFYIHMRQKNPALKPESFGCLTDHDIKKYQEPDSTTPSSNNNRSNNSRSNSSNNNHNNSSNNSRSNSSDNNHNNSSNNRSNSSRNNSNINNSSNNRSDNNRNNSNINSSSNNRSDNNRNNSNINNSSNNRSDNNRNNSNINNNSNNRSDNNRNNSNINNSSKNFDDNNWRGDNLRKVPSKQENGLFDNFGRSSLPSKQEDGTSSISNRNSLPSKQENGTSSDPNRKSLASKENTPSNYNLNSLPSKQETGSFRGFIRSSLPSKQENGTSSDSNRNSLPSKQENGASGINQTANRFDDIEPSSFALDDTLDFSSYWYNNRHVVQKIIKKADSGIKYQCLVDNLIQKLPLLSHRVETKVDIPARLMIKTSRIIYKNEQQFMVSDFSLFNESKGDNANESLAIKMFEVLKTSVPTNL